MNYNDNTPYFLKAGGEMAEIIRAADWRKTGLGDPDTWPQSLQTMVSVMLENPFGMLIAWGPDHIQLYNDGYRPMLGKTKHPQALGSSSKETFSEIWHIIGPMFDGVMRGNAVRSTDFKVHLNRNGFMEECYFDFAYSPIRDDDGNVGGVLVTVVETTNNRKIEEALKESEARFRNIADDAPVFVFLAGENAEVDYLNKTWRDYTGIDTENSKGRAWAEITHPDDIDPATAIYMDGFNKRESCTFENRQKGTDGIYRTILWKATPRFSLDGQLIGMMGVGLDIDERKKAEETLRQSEERYRALSRSLEEKVNERTAELQANNYELEKVNKELESFAYISSHDLQEPLRKIQILSSHIMDRELANLSESGKSNFIRIQTAAQRMQELINDLLSYSLIPVEEMKFEKINIGGIVDEVIHDLGEELQQKNARIEVGDMHEANVIPFQFRQLLTNLITNSLKFSKASQSPLIKIHSEYAKGDKIQHRKLDANVNYFHITIADNGIGFEQQYSEKIFEVFQRLRERNEYKGTGIGLAIVKKIVDNHNGVIVATGQPDVGAKFDIYIPEN